ncbi:unnamed protein product, partial [Rotaria magnacalcarata]
MFEPENGMGTVFIAIPQSGDLSVLQGFQFATALDDPAYRDAPVPIIL